MNHIKTYSFAQIQSKTISSEQIGHPNRVLYKMFESFFPKPKLFFGSLVLWIIFLITVWYSIGETLGNSLGFSLDTEEQVIGLGHFITSEFLWFDLFFPFE